MLTPPFLFSAAAAAACPAPDPAAPPPGLRPGRMALGPDGVAHVLLADSHGVCWWAITEDGEPRLRAVWPLPGPHPVAIAVAEDGEVVMAGRTSAGWAVTCVADDRSPRDLPVGGEGDLVRFGVAPDGRYARLAWRGQDGVEHYRGVDLRSGVTHDLGRVSGEGPRGGR